MTGWMWWLAVAIALVFLLWVRWVATTFQVMIRYKSGQTQQFRTKNLKVERNSFTGDMRVTWDLPATPRPMHLGVEEIESIWSRRGVGRMRR